jgi:hypothetical protein
MAGGNTGRPAPPNTTVPYTDNGLDNDGIFNDLPEDNSLTQPNYDFNYRIFPEELGGQTYNGHYMVININQQTASKMSVVNRTRISTLAPDQLSKTDALRFNIDKRFTNEGGNLGQESGISVRGNITRPRFTRRIQESIALYMPNAELTFNDTHDFENISLTKFGASVAGGLMTFAGASIGAMFGRAAAFAGGAGLINNSLTGVSEAAKILGSPINPKVEVLYANTMQREHRFDFIFAPSSANESRNLRQIIRTLRFHAAPELRAGNGPTSFFWIPPAEFDITFFYRGKENLRIPRINTCALTQIDVSYSPNGTWSTFHDGYPTQIRMQLAFRETEVTHKLRVLQGF